ncbi:MAG: hypothetical protein P8N52_07470 [Crocinitomicaceae bacterium]|nr:hypothetical protein [Crocinitomicaceae bacterium]MDG1777489.1 hypothetical protein [Crocinitomicaceae bacterium]
MTREDALLYLPHEDEGELEDLYQEKLFALKQKVLNAAPSTKLYQFHLKKMRLIHYSYAFLTGQTNDELTLSYRVDVDQTDLKFAWRDYNKNKTEIKLMLVNAIGFLGVKFSLGKLLENQRQFATVFKALNFLDCSGVILSQEADAMVLEAEIDAFVLAGYSAVKDIEKLDIENMLYQEANRLSLWLKIENNVQ